MTTSHTNRPWRVVGALIICLGVLAHPVGGAAAPLSQAPEPAPTQTGGEEFAIASEATALESASVQEPAGAITATQQAAALPPVEPVLETVETIEAPIAQEAPGLILPDAPADPAVQRTSIDQANAQFSIDASVLPIATDAGSVITYTYAYTNTSGGTLNGIITRVSWTRMSPAMPADHVPDIEQYCENSCNPALVSGPSVTRGVGDGSGNNITYTIGTLTDGQSGQFSVAMRLRRSIYPKTGQPPTRPASSMQMFVNNDLITPLIDDTISALVVGPVLRVTKSVLPATVNAITINDTVDFSMTVGNTTAPGDIINGLARADARPATNVTLYDAWPSGAEYVPTDDPPGVTRVVDTVARNIIWDLGDLDVQQSQTVVARFRKDTSNTGCNTLYNFSYRASSDEYPLDLFTSAPYQVTGVPASVSVLPALQIKSFTTADSQIAFGDETTATIVVASHYSQTVSGAQLALMPHSATAYSPGSAAPGSINAAPGINYGTPVTWTFDIAPGYPMTPTLITFTARIKAAFFTTQSPFAETRLYVPAGVPNSCIVPVSRYLPVVPRLEVQIRQFPYTALTYVEPGRPYTYEITVNNRSNQLINSIVVTAELPSSAQYPANFSYRTGTSSLNGSSREPNRVVNGNDGYVAWDGLTLQPRGNIKIIFSLMPDGYEYVLYCVDAAAASPQDAEVRASQGMCIRINPPFETSKVASPFYVIDANSLQGREVTFTMMLTNTGSQAFTVGLLDFVGKYEFVRQVSSNTGSPTARPVTGNLQWPMQTVNPGQRLEAVIVARVPQGCPDTKYENEIAFRFTARDGTIYDVVRIPPMTVTVSCTSILEYAKSVSRQNAGLYDRVSYSVRLTNMSAGQNMSDITVKDMLPSTFTYEGMSSDSNIITQPTITTGPGGRQVLKWTVANIPPSQSRYVRFVARSGNVVSRFDNWVTVSSTQAIVPKCSTQLNQCGEIDMGEGPVQGTTVSVNVEPLATLEPKMDNTGCALPGALRQYRLAMVNTNSHAYTDSTVRIRVPFGLHVIDATTSGSDGVNTLPSYQFDNNGDMLITWTGIDLPERPTGQANAQIVFYVNFRFGQVYGDVPILAEASSSDGGILKKDDVIDPIVKHCAPEGLVLMKDVHADRPRKGAPIIYQLSLVNTLNQSVTTTLSDVLSPTLIYSSTLQGPAPEVNGQTLTWNNLTIPPANGDIPGVTVVRFAVRVQPGVSPHIIINRGYVSSAQTVDTDLDTVSVVYGGVQVYLPLIRR